jgi:four helix bundle protein
MLNSEKTFSSPTPIRDRSLEYALRAIKLTRFLNLQRDRVGWVIAKQFLRSATSIGACLCEAQSGESRADFIHKCSISQKEARESKYWLTLLLKSNLVSPTRLEPLLRETDEIIAILTSILVKSKKAVAKTSSPLQNSAFRIQHS